MDRIPVELCSAIFDGALRTWLVPHPEFDLIDSINFLDGGCAPFHEYFRVERVRICLRLVCRRWNTILSAPTVRIAADSGWKSLPNYARDVHRLHAPAYYLCGTSWNCRALELLMQKQQRDKDGDPSFARGLYRTRVLSAIYRVVPEWLEDFFESNPPLCALTINAAAISESRNLHSSGVLSGLTHLRMEGEQTTGDTMLVSLPNLLVLDCDMRLRTAFPSIFTKPVPMSGWSLPKLSTLILRRVVETRILPPGCKEFVLSHRSTLAELVIYHREEQPHHKDSNSLLELVPLLLNLEVFRMAPADLILRPIDLTAGSCAERHRTLLLDSFTTVYSGEYTKKRITGNIKTLFLDQRLFSSIRLTSTWEQLKKSCLRQPRRQFGAISHFTVDSLTYAWDLGVTIQDREGVTLSDKEWESWKP